MQDQAGQQAAKQGPSKFDQSMKAQGAGHVQKAEAVQQAQAANKVDHVRQIENVNKAEKAAMNKLNPAAQESNKATAKGMDPVQQKDKVQKDSSMLMGMFGNMEKGQANLDKLISGGLSGKTFSNAELLSLQAGMYKYTQELELTGQVVEKATGGLKDTLKTQV